MSKHYLYQIKAGIEELLEKHGYRKKLAGTNPRLGKNIVEYYYEHVESGDRIYYNIDYSAEVKDRMKKEYGTRNWREEE